MGLLALELAGSPVRAAEEAPPSIALSCAGHIEAGSPIAAIGPDIAFRTIIPFGQGHFLTLSSPDSNRIEQLLYGSEVQAGSIEIGVAKESVVWTKATSLRGGVVGFFIEGGGDVTSLSIHAAPRGEADRPFDLFATASRALYRGSCH